MNVAEWLDSLEEQGQDVSRIALPEDLARSSDPDETVFFKEIRPCSVLCTGSHAFATVERFGHWYYSRGRDKEKGPHTTRPPWWLFTRDRDQAVQAARMHIEA